MGGPIIRTGPTPKFSDNWDRIFGDESPRGAASGRASSVKGKSKAGKKAAAPKKKAAKKSPKKKAKKKG